MVLSHISQFYLWDYFSTSDTTAEYLITKTPLNLFFNGAFAVCCFLSAYLNSIKFFKNKSTDYFMKSIIKRYIKFACLILVAVIFAYILLCIDAYQYFTLYTDDPRYLNIDKNIFKMIRYAVYSVFVRKDGLYINVLWTIHMLFFGVLLVFSFLAIFGRNKIRFFIYLVLCYFLKDTHYLAFILGVFLCDIEQNKLLKQNKIVTYVLLIISIYFISQLYAILGLDHSIYKILDIKILNITNNQVFFQIIGVFLLMYCVQNLDILKKLFSMKLFVYLGKLSFGMFLFHFPIIATLSFYLFHVFEPLNQYLRYLLSIGISCIVIFMVSNIIAYGVEPVIAKIAKRLLALIPNNE